MRTDWLVAAYDLILVARNRERLDALAARLERETHAMVEPYPPI